MTAFFTIVIFLAAALLFGVQPMVAKSLLPGFGGGSSVWTTCMLFFQTVLIAGYMYAHLLLRLPRIAQLMVHVGVIASALAAGWLYRVPSPPPGASEFPVPWLLGQLLLVAGLPYFAVSSAGPLVQGWFARTGSARAGDPYFLYAASNAGSLIGLLAYPFLIEPRLGLDDQRWIWLVLFGVFGLCAIGCVLLTRKGVGDRPVVRPSEAVDASPITWKRRLWWVFLAFVPSSMLLGVTTHLTTEVASFPLLWVVPLALYLLTMIVAFSGKAGLVVRHGVRPMILAVVAAWVLLVAWDREAQSVPVGANIAVQMILLGAVGLYGHARLARDRPPASHLTEFYLIMSIGGALGGLFNGVLAPLIFPDVFEYHTALLLAILMIPVMPRGTVSAGVFWRRRLVFPLISSVAVALTVVVARQISDPSVRVAVTVIPAALLVYMAWRDRIACAGALVFPLAAVVIGGLTNPDLDHRERTFFGVHKVERKAVGGATFRRLLHGTTLHGLEMIEGPGPGGVPLGYYHPRGPLGGLMRSLHLSHPEGLRAGIVGLGTGAIAAYSQPGDTFVFYEIDPAVARIAADPELFTFMSRSKGKARVELGDGRLLLEQAAAAGEAPFDVLLIDAFSSDAIPTHLLTVEAVRLYAQRIAPDGVIVMHISNRHLDLSGLLLSTAESLGLIALINDDGVDQEYSDRTGHFSSTWVAVTASEAVAERLTRQGFVGYDRDRRPAPWTDQSSDLLGVWGFD
jgi:hypothetical protein